MRKKLQDVHESILAVNPKQIGGSRGNPLKGILPYALKSLIEEYPLLEEEFKRRANYYPNLSKDKKYLDFIAGLHKKMKEIQYLINPAKLPPTDKQMLKRPKHDPFDDDDKGVDSFWIDMKELHADLTKPEKWWYLGDKGMPCTVNDSVAAPWSHVFGQYETVLSLMLQAFDSGALEECKSNFDVCVAWKEDLRTLKEMFEKPIHHLHVDAFESLQHKMLSPEWMGDDEKDIERAQKYADRVCKDLMLFLDEQDNQQFNKNKRPVFAPIEGMREKTNSNNGDVFRYGNSITDSGYIWKEGNKDDGQRFNKGNKRRHIWEFCMEFCNQGFQPLNALNKYVSDKCKRPEHVSPDDMKAFLPIISRFSDVSLKELKTNYIIFKEGEGIEVKMIP